MNEVCDAPYRAAPAVPTPASRKVSRLDTGSGALVTLGSALMATSQPSATAEGVMASSRLTPIDFTPEPAHGKDRPVTHTQIAFRRLMNFILAGFLWVAILVAFVIMWNYYTFEDDLRPIEVTIAICFLGMALYLLRAWLRDRRNDPVAERRLG